MFKFRLSCIIIYVLLLVGSTKCTPSCREYASLGTLASSHVPPQKTCMLHFMKNQIVRRSACKFSSGCALAVIQSPATGNECMAILIAVHLFSRVCDWLRVLKGSSQTTCKKEKNDDMTGSQFQLVSLHVWYLWQQ